jgi:hypothetical protein
MYGYKGFHSDLKGFNNFQYEVGKTYTMIPDQLKLGHSGFHFCQFPIDVFDNYDEDDDQYARIKAEDRIIQDEYRSVTNQLTIIELLSRDQLISLMSGEIVRKNGNKEWYKGDQLHRLWTCHREK